MGYLYQSNEEAVDSIFKIINTDKKLSANYLKTFSQSYNDIENYKRSIRSVYEGGESEHEI